MPLPETINRDATREQVCAVASRWMISLELATQLHIMARMLPFGISIISGYRTEAQEDDLRRQGRPTAPPGTSTHTSCPATGADLRVSVAVTTAVKAQLGTAAVAALLRWGGGSPIDPETGIPVDWNHVDTGPRRQ